MNNRNKIPFRQLCGKSIVGNMGGILGKVRDVIFDENTGKIISLDMEPSENSPIYEQSSKGCYTLVPYKIVLGIKDVVVVDENRLNCIKIIEKEE
ncbi:MAG TPA: hypothetical protein EYH55_02070 [Methanothermococcus okinawensis]|uniref:PRC-barrel domain-containing protein n=1 Tax=Methanothermococcus okinawensis TaxID=155863 RepID=A0A832ZY24_9EURY|nr:hypothetical protein [Methanothermococcus okinawensis]